MYKINTLWPIIAEFLDKPELWGEPITDGASAQPHNDDEEITVWRADTVLFPSGKYGVDISERGDGEYPESPATNWYMMVAPRFTRFKEPYLLRGVILSVIHTYEDILLTETDPKQLRLYIDTLTKHEQFLRSLGHASVNHILDVWGITQFSKEVPLAELFNF
jgi:hypothetical protein